MLHLEIITPDGIAFSAEVDMATFPGVEGQFGVLPGHVHLMTGLVPGEIIATAAGKDTYIACGEGMLEVTATSASLLTDMAVASDQIDEAKAEEARLRAEARLKEKLSAEEVANTNAALTRSLAQLRVKRRHRQ